MVIKISDIVGFFRRLLGLRKPEKAGEDIPLEKQEILEEKEKVEEKKPPHRKRGRSSREREENRGEKEKPRRAKPVDVTCLRQDAPCGSAVRFTYIAISHV